MQNEINLGGFFRHNRKLENCLLAVGIALFIALGMRGLDKINDRAVAAGEANRNIAFATDSTRNTQLSTSQIIGLISPVPQAGPGNPVPGNSTDNNAKGAMGKPAEAGSRASDEDFLSSNARKTIK
jgi:hypothetical protein